MPDFDRTFQNLCEYVRETALLSSIEELLGWDQQTMLPAAAAEYRAEQMTYLSGTIHRRRTSAELGGWLAELAESPWTDEPHSDRGATIRELTRDYERQTKLPADLVRELTRAAVLGQQVWAEARKNDDFASFQPSLERIVKLKREEAAALGYDDEPYDALLDDYEPGAKTAEVAGVLEGLRSELAPLIAAIADSDRKAPVELLKREYPVAVQKSFVKQAAKAIGFDFQRGRLDVTHHPFCSSMGPDDCRITTRYDDRFFSSAFFGTMHEAGHGIYDQGLRGDQHGLPPGTFVSLGIHESQSRMWENVVGRSLAFWKHFFPLAQNEFPNALRAVSLDQFYFAINNVTPSLIRVEADEATYNLHIIIRFELERALLNKDLNVGDLPDAWNEKYQKYLGIQSPDNADGVLQDIHWGAALIGYFPTYTLGNLYAAQFYAQATNDLGDLDEPFSKGDFRPLRDWLREKIHRQGQCYQAPELGRLVTGRPLSHEPLVAYLRGKLEPLYGI